MKRVFAALPPGVHGGSDLATAQFAPRLGRSLADVAAEPHGLLQDRFARLAAHARRFGCWRATRPDENRAAGFFRRHLLPPGGLARREMPQTPSENVDQRQRIAQKRRHVQAILDQANRHGRLGRSVVGPESTT